MPGKGPISARVRTLRRGLLPLALTAVLAACSGANAIAGASDEATGTGATTATEPATSDKVDFLDESMIHEISVEFDPAAFQTMVDTYSATGEKDWIEATVSIDGAVYEDVGIRLKGNSSLRGLFEGGRGSGDDTSTENPETLPWLIRLDKYVDDQSHEGLTDIVVRSNTTETALNEAVSLDLLEEAGLASQDSAYASFSVNGSSPTLRLIMEHPDDVWMDTAFADPGVLYKAEATGDYSYRGADPEAYDEVFDIEAGDENGDLTPLIEFLDFINNTDTETFNAELGDHLDLDSFATYLAIQDSIDNFDDIDGPGNNSYLFYDIETGLFTVVPWDHNLAFGVGPGGGPARGTGDENPPPRDGAALRPEPGEERRGPGPGGPGGSNVLVDRFLGNPEWETLYESATTRLQTDLFSSGVVEAILEKWTGLLESEVPSLIDADTLDAESDAIRASLS